MLSDLLHKKNESSALAWKSVKIYYQMLSDALELMNLDKTS